MYVYIHSEISGGIEITPKWQDIFCLRSYSHLNISPCLEQRTRLSNIYTPPPPATHTPHTPYSKSFVLYFCFGFIYIYDSNTYKQNSQSQSSNWHDEYLFIV